MVATSVSFDPAGPLGILSPHAAASVEIGGLTWPTAAHYLLAARCFFDRDRREQIRTAGLEAARALAEAPGNYEWKGDRQGTFAEPHMYWGRSVPNLVRRVIFERATTDPSFAAALEGTGDQPLTLAGADALVPAGLWTEQLAEMRDRLRLEDAATLRSWRLPPLVQHPEIPRGSIGWRMGHGESYAFALHEWRAQLPTDQRARWDRAWAAARAG